MINQIPWQWRIEAVDRGNVRSMPHGGIAALFAREARADCWEAYVRCSPRSCFCSKVGLTLSAPDRLFVVMQPPVTLAGVL